MSRPVILITGASRGLGAALAAELGARGTQLVLVARTQGGLTATDDAIRAAGGPPAALLPLDLATQHDEIDLLGAELFRRYGRLDGLVLNAAYLGALSPVTHQPVAQFNTTMAVNVTANYRLLRSMEPLLQAANNPLILGMDCASLPQHDAFWGAYRASKLALGQLLHSFVAEQASGKIQLGWHDPGPMATGLHRTAYPGIVPTTLPTAATAAASIANQFFGSITSH